MKKKYSSRTDDLSFGHVTGEPESFAKIFDPARFDREAEIVFHKKEKQPEVRKNSDEKTSRTNKPQSELDLHGCTARKAEIKVNDFVLAARQQSLLCVRIITGRGLHSHGPAVLPDVVEQKIRELKERGVLHGYQWDKGDKNKSGAILVWLG